MGKPKEIPQDRIKAVEHAVYRLAEGPYCRATNREVAEMAKVPISCAGECLRVLRDRNVLKLYDWRDGLSVRFHIILAHPQADEAMANHYCPIPDPRPYLRVVGL